VPSFFYIAVLPTDELRVAQSRYSGSSSGFFYRHMNGGKSIKSIFPPIIFLNFHIPLRSIVPPFPRIIYSRAKQIPLTPISTIMGRFISNPPRSMASRSLIPSIRSPSSAQAPFALDGVSLTVSHSLDIGSGSVTSPPCTSISSKLLRLPPVIL
jgi:hypothetical protein